MNNSEEKKVEIAKQFTLDRAWINFNMNDLVLVKLTPFGREMLKKDHDELWNSNNTAYKYQPVIEDEEGWSKWQMWVLMSFLGKYFAIGCDLPFEMDVKIELRVRG